MVSCDAALAKVQLSLGQGLTPRRVHSCYQGIMAAEVRNGFHKLFGH